MKSQTSLLTILASVYLTSTGLMAQQPQPLNDTDTVNRIADAIFRAEHSTRHPYGIMITCTNPRNVCINTINHAWIDFERQSKINGTGKMNNLKGLLFTLTFISFLGHRYCPPSIDPIGYHNWTNNVYRIVNHKQYEHNDRLNR